MADENEIRDVSGEYRVSTGVFTQSEQRLEDDLVAQLIGLDYKRAHVTDETSLLTNLKTQLE